VEWQLLPRLALSGFEWPHIVVESRDFHTTAAVLHLRDHLGKRERRIGNSASERAGVEICLAAAEIDLTVHKAPEAITDGGHTAIEHRGIGDDNDVGLE